MKNIKLLNIIWKTYSIAGAAWLTFSIISITFLTNHTKHHVSGTIKETFKTDWDGYKDVYARVETKDGKGDVLATLYRSGVDTGDEVSLEIVTGGTSGKFMHAHIIE